VPRPRNGGGRIRTYVGISRQIYSLLHLATLVPHRPLEGAPGEIRTPDPLIRSQMLYPAELRALAVPRTSGAEGNRTPDLLNAIQALSQLSYGPLIPIPASACRGGISSPASSRTTDDLARLRTPVFKRAGPTGLEPATSGVTVRHSNRLSYGP
jgi:hypothetical protein